MLANPGAADQPDRTCPLATEWREWVPLPREGCMDAPRGQSSSDDCGRYDAAEGRCPHTQTVRPDIKEKTCAAH